jgi:hypothetical protein
MTGLRATPKFPPDPTLDLYIVLLLINDQLEDAGKTLDVPCREAIHAVLAVLEVRDRWVSTALTLSVPGFVPEYMKLPEPLPVPISTVTGMVNGDRELAPATEILTVSISVGICLCP